MKDKFDLISLNDARMSIIHNLEHNNTATFFNKDFYKKMLLRIEDLMLDCASDYYVENGTMHPDSKKIKKWKSPIGDSTIVKVHIDTRKEKFKSNAKMFASEIGMADDALKSFNEYWLEKNKSETKLKFEMQETFEIKRRMIKWNNNSIDWAVKKVKKQSFEANFKKTKTGLYIAYCSRCGKKETPNDSWQLKDGSNCCRVEYMPEGKAE